MAAGTAWRKPSQADPPDNRTDGMVQQPSCLQPKKERVCHLSGMMRTSGQQSWWFLVSSSQKSDTRSGGPRGLEAQSPINCRRTMAMTSHWSLLYSTLYAVWIYPRKWLHCVLSDRYARHTTQLHSRADHLLLLMSRSGSPFGRPRAWSLGKY